MTRERGEPLRAELEAPAHRSSPATTSKSSRVRRPSANSGCCPRLRAKQQPVHALGAKLCSASSPNRLQSYTHQTRFINSAAPSPVNPTISSIMLHVRNVSRIVALKYSLNIQKPLSLKW